MKKYLATEVRRIAENVTQKKNKQLFYDILNDVMYLIEEAARDGKYKISFNSSKLEGEEMCNTFESIMRGYGYNVHWEPMEDWIIEWGGANV